MDDGPQQGLASGMERFFHKVQGIVWFVFVIPDLKVEVGTSTPPSAAYKPNHFALSNRLAPKDAALFQVSIQGGPAVRMSNFDQVSESRPVIPSKDYFSSIRGKDRRSRFCSEVDSVVVSRSSHSIARTDEAIVHWPHKLLLGFLDLHRHHRTNDRPFCEPPDVHGCDLGRDFVLGCGRDPPRLDVADTSDAWFFRPFGHGCMQALHHISSQILQRPRGPFHSFPGASVDSHRSQHELRGHVFGGPPSLAPSEAHGDVQVRLVPCCAIEWRVFRTATRRLDHHNARGVQQGRNPRRKRSHRHTSRTKEE